MIINASESNYYTLQTTFRKIFGEIYERTDRTIGRHLMCHGLITSGTDEFERSGQLIWDAIKFLNREHYGTIYHGELQMLTEPSGVGVTYFYKYCGFSCDHVLGKKCEQDFREAIAEPFTNGSLLLYVTPMEKTYQRNVILGDFVEIRICSYKNEQTDRAFIEVRNFIC